MQRIPTVSRSLIAIFSLAIGWAEQPTPPSFFRADFLKSKPGKQSEYVDFLKKDAGFLAQSQIKAGKLQSYGYGQVFTPTGSGEEHNLVGLYGYSSWEQMEISDAPPAYIIDAMKTLGFTSPQDYTAKRNVLRDLVRSEIWRRVAGTTPTADSAPKAGDWVAVAYIKTSPGKGTDYDKIWKAFSLPIQEERVKAGNLKSYSMYAVYGGGGSEAKYDRIAVQRYASFKDVGPNAGPADSDATAEKVHAAKDWRQMRRDMASLRSLYRTELAEIKLWVQ